MNLYYVQYIIKNIKPEYLESYYSNVEKELRKLFSVDVKHSFVSNGKVYISVYTKERDAKMAGKANFNHIESAAVSAINFSVDEHNIEVDIEKVEQVPN